ncbi:alpha-N-acetylgalactosaminide alpha-2,6-sialyltransferase 1-like [Solea senegalensis]|uniref:Alpha-N-acetylgalactosaminide alpha-2,6-sialyltransferase 1-like n=1 Tax=Solea senegalensis TaxID=28829 RepID=A0AAV6QD41_SOLSE|nr:alpha-N-acetylgalactosaminide alpha-2,6-sialyltransferase 1-like [Solea senegalensis]
MNGAVIKGYEEDVGNRTSVYVHTAHSITTSLYVFKQYGYTSVPADEVLKLRREHCLIVMAYAYHTDTDLSSAFFSQDIKFVLIPEGMRDFIWLESLLKGEKITKNSYRNAVPRNYYAGRYNESRFYVLHQDFLRYVRNRFLLSAQLNNSYWAIVRPTNGAFTLFLALHTCDTVSAYGFMTENFEKYSNYYVQRNIKTRVIFYANHDYYQEMRMWKKLHQSKILKLYERLESESVTEKPH